MAEPDLSCRVGAEPLHHGVQSLVVLIIVELNRCYSFGPFWEKHKTPFGTMSTLHAPKDIFD